MNDSKTWNIVGAIVGILLGLLSVLGIVTSQTGNSVQANNSVIAYDEAS